jgi:DNA-binding HxlR family transcriptional regulator
MLIQQLRHMERDGVVRRFVHHQVPPKVEYSLTDWGQALCPALDALLTWVDLRPSTEAVPGGANSRNTDPRYRSGVFGASDRLT